VIPAFSFSDDGVYVIAYGALVEYGEVKKVTMF